MARRSAKRVVLDRMANAYAQMQLRHYEWMDAKKEHPIYSDTVRDAERNWYMWGAIRDELMFTAMELGATDEEIGKANRDGDTLFIARLAKLIAEKR